MDSSVIDLLVAFFGGIWNGLETICIPGTSWTITGFLLAVFTAGVIGKILHGLFGVFSSHFSRHSSEKRKGVSNLDDD